MIKQYQFYSTSLQTKVIVSYYDGKLKSFELEVLAENVEFEKDKLVKFLMYEETFLQESKSRKIAIIQLNREVTFDMFWDRYKYKTSGKDEAQRAWKKLSKDNQLAAYDYIPVYESILKQNPVAKQHGSSYLNAKRWIK